MSERTKNKYAIGQLIRIDKDRYLCVSGILSTSGKEYYEFYDLRYPEDFLYREEEYIDEIVFLCRILKGKKG